QACIRQDRQKQPSERSSPTPATNRPWHDQYEQFVAETIKMENRDPIRLANALEPREARVALERIRGVRTWLGRFKKHLLEMEDIRRRRHEAITVPADDGRSVGRTE